jgi:hypothetical protein
MTGKLVLLRLSLAGNLEKSPNGGSMVIKSNTVTRYKITSGLQNRLHNHRRVPVCRNKQFKRGLLDGFSQLVSVFTEASQNLIFKYLHNKAAKKFKNYTESIDLIF